MNSKKQAAKPRVAAKAKPGKAKSPAPLNAVEDGKDGKPAFDFVGRVERMTVRAKSGGFEFELRGRGSTRQSFRLGGADPVALTVMSQMVAFAHATNAKVGVRSQPSADGLPHVLELATGNGLGKRS